VYVADVRLAGADGNYVVRAMSRDDFDGLIDRARPAPAPEATSDAVVIYKASWCGACKAAAGFLRDKHVSFTEKDVEKDPGAQQEMLKKAQDKGLSPTGVPVIDFRGEIMLGFDRGRLAALIDRDSKAI
jgi:glutaredoxin